MGNTCCTNEHIREELRSEVPGSTQNTYEKRSGQKIDHNSMVAMGQNGAQFPQYREQILSNGQRVIIETSQAGQNTRPTYIDQYQTSGHNAQRISNKPLTDHELFAEVFRDN